ncbi:MAG: CinA family protein [Ruminococcaceae bacterium]|nr:CinA family protein [Oscillospiraceae bacterium]
MINENNLKKAEKLVLMLKEKGLKVTFAESCTGGLLGATLTAVSGASAVFDGSVVSYANEVKNEKLGVDKKTLESVGAVSNECAREMALGALKMFSSDCAAAITGIAGPLGGSAEKPVGTVFIAAAFGDKVTVEHCLFAGDRESIREQSVAKALDMLAEMICKS